MKPPARKSTHKKAAARKAPARKAAPRKAAAKKPAARKKPTAGKMPGGPLAGIRILDASHVLAGPFATYQLCLLGAEAIRVERVAGDDFIRYHGGTPEMREKGLGASFIAQNAGKQCIQLDLKQADGRDIFLKLAAQADVVMENYRPGVMERLGLGYDDIRAVNPDVVYCSLTGYGDVGPLSGSPAYDHILQGMTGLMSMTGTPESGPQRVGLPITDYIAGLTAAFAITGALCQRLAGGPGQHLQVSMLGSVLSFMGAFAADLQTTGTQRGLQGNAPFSGSPFAGCFDTAKGKLVVTANTAAQARRLADLMGDATLAADADKLDRGGTFSPADRERINKALEARFKRRPALDWELLLADAAVPAAKVRDLAEVLGHAQTIATGCLTEVPVPGLAAPLSIPGLGFTSDAWKVGRLAPPDLPGAQTKEILKGLGYSAAAIQRLKRNGVIGG